MTRPSADAAGAPAGETRCPRCGGGFHCGVAGSLPCACSRYPIGAETLAMLRQRFTGCLCTRCLAELAAAAPAPRPEGANGRPG